MEILKNDYDMELTSTEGEGEEFLYDSERFEIFKYKMINLKSTLKTTSKGFKKILKILRIGIKLCKTREFEWLFNEGKQHGQNMTPNEILKALSAAPGSVLSKKEILKFMQNEEFSPSEMYNKFCEIPKKRNCSQKCENSPKPNKRRKE